MSHRAPAQCPADSVGGRSLVIDDGAGRRAGDLDTPERRDSLITAIGALAADLLTHLAFEEERIGPVLRTLTRWPGFVR